jgi:hypothetical protein
LLHCRWSVSVVRSWHSRLYSASFLTTFLPPEIAVSLSIRVPVLNLSARWGWVVDVTPQPLYPWEETWYQLYKRWVGPRANMHKCGISLPPKIGSPDCPYWLWYASPH